MFLRKPSYLMMLAEIGACIGLAVLTAMAVFHAILGGFKVEDARDRKIAAAVEDQPHNTSLVIMNQQNNRLGKVRITKTTTGHQQLSRTQLRRIPELNWNRGRRRPRVLLAEPLPFLPRQDQPWIPSAGTLSSLQQRCSIS